MHIETRARAFTSKREERCVRACVRAVSGAWIVVVARRADPSKIVDFKHPWFLKGQEAIDRPRQRSVKKEKAGRGAKGKERPRKVAPQIPVRMTKMQQHPVAAAARIAHEEHILEAIDQLRRRKARPDADRICNYLLRKFSVDARDTIADLHRLIEVEKVIQVDYKGNTSYRNAKKWSRLQLFKNRPEGFLKEKLNSGMVSSAVAELVVGEPDYLDQGVPAGRLIEQLLDGVSSPTSRRVVEEFLGREVASGNLARLSNGNYSLVATSDMTTDATPRRGGDSQPATAAVACAPENGNVTQRRVGKDAASNGTVGNATNGVTSATAAPGVAATQAAAELYEFNETDNLTDTTSGSNTPRSRQASNSPKLDQQLQQDCLKKEECYEIILGKEAAENRRSESPLSVACNGGHGGDGAEQRDPLIVAALPNLENDVKEETKSNDVRTMPNLKRSAKAERKQRLFARTDDRMDIEFKFEDYHQIGKEETEKHEDTSRRSSEDREDEDAGRSSSTNTSPIPSNVNASGFRSARRKVLTRCISAIAYPHRREGYLIKILQCNRRVIVVILLVCVDICCYVFSIQIKSIYIEHIYHAYICIYIMYISRDSLKPKLKCQIIITIIKVVYHNARLKK